MLTDKLFHLHFRVLGAKGSGASDFGKLEHSFIRVVRSNKESSIRTIAIGPTRKDLIDIFHFLCLQVEVAHNQSMKM